MDVYQPWAEQDPTARVHAMPLALKGMNVS